eukprot:COSAG02_NODE_217_length_28595_cov_19.642371_4_plen_83_part_00
MVSSCRCNVNFARNCKVKSRRFYNTDIYFDSLIKYEFHGEMYTKQLQCNLRAMPYLFVNNGSVYTVSISQAGLDYLGVGRTH